MLLPLLTMSVVMADNEPIKYFERSWWDEQNKQVVAVEKTCTNYTLLSGNHSDEWKGLTDGWYVVKESIVYYQTLNILGNAHIILCDGSYIILSGGVKLEGTRTLSIYGQTENSGVLSSTNTDYSNTAGIGSAKETTCGDLVIHGGTVYAEGEDKSILYLGDDNTLYYPNGDMTNGAFRGYFELKNDLSFGDLTQGNINAFVLDFGDESDSIEEAQHTTTHPSDVWYTVDGRKISGMPNARGIYIKNGKKVIIN